LAATDQPVRRPCARLIKTVARRPVSADFWYIWLPKGKKEGGRWYRAPSPRLSEIACCSKMRANQSAAFESESGVSKGDHMQRPAVGRQKAFMLLVLAGAFMLAACQSQGMRPLPCPDVLQVKDAAHLTRFEGQSEDLTDTLFEAKIDATASKCYYSQDQGKTAVRTELRIQFSAIRGPKDKTHKAPFQYFVAVTGPGQRPIAREVFDAEIEFPGNKVQNITIDEIEPKIPLQQGEDGTYYRIFTGFILTEKELAFNRKNPR